MAEDKKDLLDCTEDVNADNSCVQAIQIKGGLAPIDYRKLSHKPSLDGIFDPEESQGAIADAGAVGARLKVLDDASEKYNQLLHEIYSILYDNQFSDDLDDSTPELDGDKQSNAGNRIKNLEDICVLLEQNKLNISDFNEQIKQYEKTSDHNQDITDVNQSIEQNVNTLNQTIDEIRKLIPSGLNEIISNNQLTIKTNVVKDIQNIKNRLDLDSDKTFEPITDWNIFIDEEYNDSPEKHSAGWYYGTTYNNIAHGPIINYEHIEFGEVRKITYVNNTINRMYCVVTQKINVLPFDDSNHQMSQYERYQYMYISSDGTEQNKYTSDWVNVTREIYEDEFVTMIDNIESALEAEGTADTTEQNTSEQEVE